jgi:hypothetical protein
MKTQNTTFLIEGVYTTLDKQELQENMKIANNIADLLSNYGIETILYGTQPDEWIKNPEEEKIKHNKLFKTLSKENKILFMQTKQNNYLARERFREIQDFYRQQEITNQELIDLENMTEQEIKTKFKEDFAKNKKIWMQSELGLIIETYAPNKKMQSVYEK